MAQAVARTQRRTGQKSSRLRAIVSTRALDATAHQAHSTPQQQLEEFGEWGTPSRWSLPNGAYRTAIARWFAIQGVGKKLDEGDWLRCQAAVPGAFKQYRTLRLHARSFFLPAGEAVFEVLENPIAFPEVPPDPIMSNFLRGITLYPNAPFYYFEPVVKIEGRRMTPLLRPGLEVEIRSEQLAVQQLLDDRRWRFLAEHQARRAAAVVGDLSLTAISALLSGGITVARALFTSTARLRVEMKALEPSTLQSEGELRELLEEAMRLNMRKAAETFSSRLRKFDPIITFDVDGIHRLAGHWFHIKHEGQTVLKWHD